MEITRLREAIVEEMQKKNAYGLEASSASSASAPTSLSSPSPEQELAKLTEKVREVYESVVTTEAKASSIEAVDMLREIEETLERYFVEIENAQRRRRRARTQDRKEDDDTEIERVEDAATKSRARVAIEETLERAASPARKSQTGNRSRSARGYERRKKEMQQNSNHIPKEREEIELKAFRIVSFE